MTRLARTLLVPVLLLTIPLALAQTPTPDPDAQVRDLVAREELRAKVEKILAGIATPINLDSNDLNTTPLFTSVSEQLIALGPEITPFLVAEVDGKSKLDFHIAAYVLGFLHAPGAKETLRRAAEAAERDGGDFGRDRKVWAGYALAVMGDPDALDLLDTGKINAVRKEIIGRVSTIELVAMLTAPGSRARLVERLSRYNTDPTISDRLYLVLHAIQRVADPSVIPALLPYLDHPDAYVRDAAARALAATGDPAVVDRLLAKLDDPSPFTRTGIANAIEELAPPGKWKLLLDRLGAQNFPAVRASLYRTIAATGGEAALEPLIKQWGHGDGLDRVLLVDAVSSLDSKKSINFMRTALKDPDMRVVLRATNGLAAIGGGGPTETLLAQLADPRPTVELEAAKVLVRAQEPRAAPRLAENQRRILAVPLGDPADRDIIRERAMALVRLHDTSTLPDVRAALAAQTDPTLLDDLRHVEKLLAILDANKDDPAKWLAALAAGDPDARRLAYLRLADLRVASAVGPLVEAFGRVDVDEGSEILRCLGRLGAADAAPLVERVLLDPSFDASERAPLRSVAAWTAHRIGGPNMTEAVRKSIERRDGREFDVLAEYAAMAGREALPLLQTVRVTRLRYHDWRRGPEVDRIDKILRNLRAGRPVAVPDRDPDQLSWI